MFYRALTDEQTLRVRRARPVIALAAVAFAIGAIVGANGGSSSADSLAQRFVTAWARNDYAAMYADVDAPTRRSLNADEFAGVYHEAMRTATATSLRAAGKPHSEAGGVVRVPVRVQHTTVRHARAERARARHKRRRRRRHDRLVALAGLSGLHAGETLSRRTTLPRRATLLARDGSVLAEGEATRPGRASRRWANRRARWSAKSARSPAHAAWRWKWKACPPTPTSARAAWSARSTRACAERQAASCSLGSACSRRRCRTPRTPCARASRRPCSARPCRRSARSSAAS